MMDVSKDVGGEIAFAIFVAEKKVDTARIDAARAEIGIVYIGLDWIDAKILVQHSIMYPMKKRYISQKRKIHAVYDDTDNN